MRNNDTFVIGDIHGHIDRLEALLKQEGLLDEKGNRLRPEVTVVQLGDFGHWGDWTRETDATTLAVAPAWLDVMLWGNHDRALISKLHEFGGYRWSYYGGQIGDPDGEKAKTVGRLLELRKEGKLKLAYETHGFLLTHAGLHPEFMKDSLSAKEVAHLLNKLDGDDSKHPIRDAVSFERGGSHFQGGILWRDAREDLSFAFPQIFGHTAHPPQVRKYSPDDNSFTSYCIDIGDKGEHGELAGIWLPSEKVVQIAV